MLCEIVIRKARAEDEAARAALVRNSFAGYQRDAFFLFFFQELTLQAGVLLGAVLFIFCGVSPAALLLLPPALAAGVAAAVLAAHAALADKHVQEMRKELVGFVAELRGPLLADARAARPTVRAEGDGGDGGHEGGGGHGGHSWPVHTQVVGTVSVSEFWGPETAGWLHAFSVHTEWRRRGAGLALVRAARGWARAAGRGALHAAASELQAAGAACLRAAGFRPRGQTARRLLGPHLTLALQQLALDLTDTAV